MEREEMTLRSECHMRDSDCVNEMIYSLNFYLYKRANTLIF